jgi:hypothetical protein
MQGSSQGEAAAGQQQAYRFLGVLGVSAVK